MKKTLAALLLLSTLTACDLGPAFVRPDTAMPAGWKKGDKVVEGETTINADWWRNFKSAELDALMNEALAQNLDLRASLARTQRQTMNSCT